MTNSSMHRPELIIALVCPLGTRVDALEDAIRDELSRFAYDCEPVRLSALLERLTSWTPEPDSRERTRIEHRQEVAFRFRQRGGPDVLALAAIAAIRERRQARSGDPDKPSGGCAYVLRQLKHPSEIETLRRVYGASFVVVAGHSPEENRIKWLADSMAQKEGRTTSGEFENDARRLIEVDAKENNPEDEPRLLGQNTRDTYPLADYFVRLDDGDAKAVSRFIELIFGHPFHTPTVDEMAMHQAQAVALRSSDERRQVGAVIVERVAPRSGGLLADATVIASGMNEVPRRGGGYYWEGDSLDNRDQEDRRRHGGVDREDRIKLDALREITSRLKEGKWLADAHARREVPDLADELLRLLKRTQFTDISEFMRQVHAEMAAIVDAAMRGVAVRGTHMYVTTFPCHGCAKHIIAAGIAKVVYLEPYPKSRAQMLHDAEIELDPKNPSAISDRVLFVPFSGVAPRQFARLFSMAARGRKNGLALSDWLKQLTTLSPPTLPAQTALPYTPAERAELKRLPADFR